SKRDWSSDVCSSDLSGSIGVLLALAAVFFSQIEQFIPEDFFDETIKWVVGLSLIFIIGLVSIVLLILYVLGIAGTMIKYGKFTRSEERRVGKERREG